MIPNMIGAILMSCQQLSFSSCELFDQLKIMQKKSKIVYQVLYSCNLLLKHIVYLKKLKTNMYLIKMK